MKKLLIIGASIVGALTATALDEPIYTITTSGEGTNDIAAHSAMSVFRSERGERDVEKASGTTPELRKTVAQMLVKVGKRVASKAKHRKDDEPKPEPTPEQEPTT